jgi:nitrate/TMAO reductase-like tetraheme cytochrome c subunit
MLPDERRNVTMRALKLSVMLFILTIPFSSYADKAKTLDEMVKMYDSSSCKECHEEIYMQWEKSHHARPLMGVNEGIFLKGVLSSAFGPKDIKKATKKNFPCFKCHLPQALDAEDSVSAEIAQAVAAGDKSVISKLQITCIVCHNTKAIIHRLQKGKPEKDVVYGSQDIPEHGDSMYTKGKKSVILNEAIFCGQCHGLGPNFDAENPYQCATLYGSYLHAYIPSGGTQTCQECHMKNGDHLIAPDWNDPATAGLLSRAISLDVQTLGYEWLRAKGDLRPMIVVNTTITHTAGHRIPDG